MYISKTHMKMLNSIKLILSIDYQHFTVTVLLEYINLFTMCMKIMLGTYYSVNFMFDALPVLKVN